MRRLIWLQVLWPSFLVGGAAETVFFTLFDPMELALFGQPVTLSRTAVYSLGFFLFWMFSVASSALTVYLMRTSDEINGCPLEGVDRPPGCPARDERAGQ